MIPCVTAGGMDAVAHRVLLVGCGRMGGALLSGWLDTGAADRIHVIEPAIAQIAGPAPDHPAVSWAEHFDALPPDFHPEVVVFAVKPQQMDRVVPLYRGFAGQGTVFLSIAAGRTLHFFEERLGAAAAIVRAMPNTPAAIGRGISVLVANRNVDRGQRETCYRLIEAVGAVEWVDDEGLLDAVTALSGSGPAYVFLLIEAMAQAGAAAGLPPHLAMRLARDTVIGAGALAAESGTDAATLRHNVTSPGGTTAAALQVLMAPDGLQPLIDRAIAAATRRSKELAG